jgi:predicted DNA-binding protein YlxM (UPF0122 family)
MTNLEQLDPQLQTTILYLSGNFSFSEIGQKLNISKQAVQKRFEHGFSFFKTYNAKKISQEDYSKSQELIKKQAELISHLRQQLILASAFSFILSALIEKVKKFFPKIRLTRFSAGQKKHILDLLEKFQKAGGTIKIFAAHINKSPETLIDWKKAYELFGLNGLIDKPTKPNNFGNKLPSWIRDQLLMLFMKFPSWSEYQYHCYIKHNPSTNWYVSIPTIKKLKTLQESKSAEEKNRILKRWAFAEGTEAWTIDFTVIQQTDQYKLQLLTVSDCRSRFMFESVLLLETSTEIVIKHLEELFLKYGKPKILKADNGPEFRIECREELKKFSVYLFSSPTYYGQFNGSHERKHRMLKNYISDFETHKNISRIVVEIEDFTKHYNYDFNQEYLNNKTPFEILNSEKNFIPKNVEIVKPYFKDNELRMKFTGRDGSQSRMTIPEIK